MSTKIDKISTSVYKAIRWVAKDQIHCVQKKRNQHFF